MTDPDDQRVIWRCPQDGCSHAIWEAGDPKRADHIEVSRHRAIAKLGAEHYAKAHPDEALDLSASIALMERAHETRIIDEARLLGVTLGGQPAFVVERSHTDRGEP